MENFYLWLVVAVLFLLMEIGSPGLFYFLSFCCAAVMSALMCFVTDSAIVQSLTFLGGAIFWMFVLKYCIRSWKHHKKASLTNVYALQGKLGIVLIDISYENPGQVKVQGEIWSAKSVHDVPIKAGAHIEVVAVTGAFMVVQEIKKN